MKLALYQIDAFSDRVFGGNPAAIVPLAHWLDEAVMQAIAGENNLAETAFYVPEGDGFALRWFTPTCEVDLCGHATLAAAWLLFFERGYQGEVVNFTTRSGVLAVSRHADGLQMDFPVLSTEPCDPPDLLARGLGIPVEECYRGMDYMVVVADAAVVAGLAPDFPVLAKLDRRGVVVTAPGEDGVDFVSRFFAPGAGIDEDPVTGSAHCMLTPYWAKHLGRTRLSARQLSPRGGEIGCELRGERVVLAGRAALYLRGEIHVDD